MNFERHIKGLVLSFVALFALSVTNIFFKIVAEQQLNSMLVMSSGMVFTGLAFMLVGGKTTLARDAIRSIHTWIYGLSHIFAGVLIIYTMQYISAAEASVATRFSIVMGLIIAYLTQGRNTLKQGIWGVPLVLAGVFVVLFGFETDHLGQVIFAVLAVSFLRNTSLFSIELNKAGQKADISKKMKQDLSVIGYVMSVTALMAFSAMLIVALIGSFIGYIPPAIPTIDDFANPQILLMGAIYGLTLSTLIRFTQFKSVQYVKSEIFQCVTAFIPLVTLALEIVSSKMGLIEEASDMSETIALANVLVISGALIIIIRKYASLEETDADIIKKAYRKVEDSLAFFGDDYKLVAEKLSVPIRVINDIIDDVEHKKPVLKRHIAAISDNYANTVLVTDKITKLPKREVFEAEIREMEEARDYSLIFIDLNKFKPVNDTYGHEVGDEVLRVTGKRIRNYITEDGGVCRLGGDEFVISLPDMHKEEAQEIAKEVTALISQPINVENVEDPVCIGAAAGVASYPIDGNCYDAVVKKADENMYEDKKHNGVDR